MNKYGVLRDLSLILNNTVLYLPYRFLRSIPYLTVDLQTQSSQLNSENIKEIIFYRQSNIKIPLIEVKYVFFINKYV